MRFGRDTSFLSNSLWRFTGRYSQVHARRLLAVAVIGAFYWQARMPDAPDSLVQTARGFNFERSTLFSEFCASLTPGLGIQTEEVDGHRYFVRNVHPSFHHIRAWISSVGASVALADLDGDGLPNDVCLVDPRTNRVIIGPVPEIKFARKRYPPFVIDVPKDRAFADAHSPEGPASIAPMGVLVGDFNEDGYPDILVYFWGRSPIIYLRNLQVPWPKGDEIPQDLYTTHELCTPPQRWFTNAATQADLDGDGHVDLIIGNYFPDYAHVLNEHANGRESMGTSMSSSFNGGRKHFFLWEQPETKGEPVKFKEGILQNSEDESVVATALDVNSSAVEPTLTILNNLGRPVPAERARQILCGWTLAVGATDLDGRLLPSVYLANDFGPDRLLYNQSTRGKLRFILLEGRRDPVTPKSKTLGHDSFKGMGVDFADVNRDGIPDIYVSNIASRFALEESHFLFISSNRLGSIVKQRQARFSYLAHHGIAPYEDKSEELGVSRSGWAWDCKLASFDNGLEFQAVQATGFIKGYRTSGSRFQTWLRHIGMVDPSGGPLKGVLDRWPVLHELATGNDLRVKNPANWPPFQPGDDLSGHQTNGFFVRASDGRFYDVAKVMRLEDPDDPMVSRGISIADVDGDGRLDFAVANQWDDSVFYHNTSTATGYCLELQLLLPLKPGSSVIEEVSSNYRGRPAIGATATIHLSETEVLTAQVDGGSGHSGKNSPEIHFGLGEMKNQPKNVEVEFSWRDPDGRCHPQGGEPQIRKVFAVGKPGSTTVVRHTLLLPWSNNKIYASRTTDGK